MPFKWHASILVVWEWYIQLSHTLLILYHDLTSGFLSENCKNLNHSHGYKNILYTIWCAYTFESFVTTHDITIKMAVLYTQQRMPFSCVCVCVCVCIWQSKNILPLLHIDIRAELSAKYNALCLKIGILSPSLHCIQILFFSVFFIIGPLMKAKGRGRKSLFMLW